MSVTCDQVSVARIYYRLLVIALALIAITFPPSTVGNPIVKRQFGKVVKLLEESIASIGEDEYADILFQEKYDKRNLTYYHAGNKKFPVFISNGLAYVDKDIHVLSRGEDYISPKDKNTFVVLKKSSFAAGSYSLHLAYIGDVTKLMKGGKVMWNDGRVEQLKNIGPLLKQMGNNEVQVRAIRAKRPLCDWIGYTLFCNTLKHVPPARERKERQPMDEEDDEPVKLYGINSDEGAPAEAAKQKRFTDAESLKEAQKEDSKRKVNELYEESDEEKPPPPTRKSRLKVVVRTTASTPSTTKPPHRPTSATPKVKVVEINKEEEKEEDVKEKNGETEDKVTKKKHKKKHKSKKKNAEKENKEKERR